MVEYQEQDPDPYLIGKPDPDPRQNEISLVWTDTYAAVCRFVKNCE